MISVVVILLLLYSGFVTWALVYYKGKADKSDEYHASLAESEHARMIERETYYKNNKAYQHEVDILKNLVHNMHNDLDACRDKLRKSNQSKPTDDSKPS